MEGTLKRVLDIISSSTDEDVDAFLELLKPEDHSREEMQVVYEDTLGYDPTSYYDKEDIKRIATKLEEDDSVDEEIQSFISNSKEDLVDAAYKIFDESRPVFLQAAVEEAVEDATGTSIDVEVYTGVNSEDIDDDYDKEDDDYNEEDEE